MSTVSGEAQIMHHVAKLPLVIWAHIMYQLPTLTDFANATLTCRRMCRAAASIKAAFATRMAISIVQDNGKRSKHYAVLPNKTQCIHGPFRVYAADAASPDGVLVSESWYVIGRQISK